jgi:hypothetical protein
MKPQAAIFLVASSIAAGLACSPGMTYRWDDSTRTWIGTPIPISMIRVEPNTGGGLVLAGDSVQFTATAYDNDLQPIPGLEFTWELRNASDVDLQPLGCTPPYTTVYYCLGTIVTMKRPGDPPPAPSSLGGSVDTSGLFRATRPDTIAVLATTRGRTGGGPILVFPGYPYIAGVWDIVTTVPDETGRTRSGALTIVDTAHPPIFSNGKSVWLTGNIQRCLGTSCADRNYVSVPAAVNRDGRMGASLPTVYSSAGISVVIDGDELSGIMYEGSGKSPAKASISGTRRR